MIVVSIWFNDSFAAEPVAVVSLILICKLLEADRIRGPTCIDQLVHPQSQHGAQLLVQQIESVSGLDRDEKSCIGEVRW